MAAQASYNHASDVLSVTWLAVSDSLHSDFCTSSAEAEGGLTLTARRTSRKYRHTARELIL